MKLFEVANGVSVYKAPAKLPFGQGKPAVF